VIVSNRYEDRRLRRLAAHVSGRSVLDIGYAQHPNPYLDAANTTGLDLTPPSPTNSHHYAEEVTGDVVELLKLFPGRTFDTVICAELIEHLENPYSFLRDVRSVLNDDGVLLLSTPNPLAFPVVAIEALRLKRFFYTRDHLYYFLPRWVERLLERSGYRVTGLEGVGLWTPFGSLPVKTPVSASYQVIYVAQKA